MAEVSGAVADLQKTRDGVVWIEEFLPKPELSKILSFATTFVCPSVYEPLGIVNLEAMACGAAVVGTATGGIPEVIVAGETGWLVPIEQVSDGTGTPVDPDRFVADRARQYGQAGLVRAKEHFSWAAIAEQTIDVYRNAIAAHSG
jgi:starch synthase